MGLDSLQKDYLIAAKHSLQTLCAAIDLAESKYGKPDELSMSVSELFRFESHRFLMYLSSSDGKIVPEERDFMNELFDVDLSIYDYVEIINETDTYSLEYEKSIPFTIKYVAEFEKRLREDSGIDQNTSILPLIVNFYESIGNTLIKIDGEIHPQEVEDFNTVMSVKKSYLDYIIEKLNDLEVGIIGPKK